MVFKHLLERPKSEQWVDKVVSMPSKSFQESGSKAMSSEYSTSVTRVTVAVAVASYGSPQVWHCEDRQF